MRLGLASEQHSDVRMERRRRWCSMMQRSIPITVNTNCTELCLLSCLVYGVPPVGAYTGLCGATCISMQPRRAQRVWQLRPFGRSQRSPDPSGQIPDHCMDSRRLEIDFSLNFSQWKAGDDSQSRRHQGNRKEKEEVDLLRAESIDPLQAASKEYVDPLLAQ